MRAHAQAVAGAQGDVLNVGFGMGLVDAAIQVSPKPFTPQCVLNLRSLLLPESTSVCIAKWALAWA